MWEIGEVFSLKPGLGGESGKLGEKRHTHPRATRAEMLCSLPWAPPCEPPQWSCQDAHLQDQPEAAGLVRCAVAKWAAALCSEQPAMTAPADKQSLAGLPSGPRSGHASLSRAAGLLPSWLHYSGARWWLTGTRYGYVLVSGLLFLSNVSSCLLLPGPQWVEA